MACTLWIGRRESIGIGIEATRGVGVAPTYWLNCTAFSFRDVPTRALSEAGFGGIWGGDQAPKTLEHAEGDMTVELGDQSFGAILLATLGTVVTTGPTDTTTYTHTYTLQNDNCHDSLTIHTIDPIGQLMFEMGMINTLEVSFLPDAIVGYTVNFLSKASANSANQTASYGAEKKFIGRNLTFSHAALAGSLPGTAVDLKSLTLRFEKNAEINATLSTVQPEDIVNKRFNITGEIVLNYQTRTWLNYVKNATNRAVRITMVHDDNITGSASTKYSWTIDLSKVMFEAWEPDFSLDEVVTQTLSFTALYDAGVLDNVINSCTLINGVVSY